jgi:putative component of toxin-antitoxin plasmid stabilization module
MQLAAEFVCAKEWINKIKDKKYYNNTKRSKVKIIKSGTIDNCTAGVFQLRN